MWESKIRISELDLHKVATKDEKHNIKIIINKTKNYTDSRIELILNQNLIGIA